MPGANITVTMEDPPLLPTTSTKSIIPHRFCLSELSESLCKMTMHNANPTRQKMYKKKTTAHEIGTKGGDQLGKMMPITKPDPQDACLR